MSDPAENFERHMSDPSIAGLNISLRYVGACMSMRTLEQTRNAVWLLNYTRILGLTAGQVSDLLKMSVPEIGRALTNPKADAKLLERFDETLAPIRQQWQDSRPVWCGTRPEILARHAEGRSTIATTKVVNEVRLGVAEAFEDGTFSLIEGPFRIGKSTPFREIFFRDYMDRAVYVKTPNGCAEQDYLAALAGSMGIGTGATKKVGKYKEQIYSAVATGVISGIFHEESHYLFNSARPNIEPPRIGILRSLWDVCDLARQARRGQGGLAIPMEATPQFGTDLNAALAGAWAAGQFEGRLRRTILPATLTDDEIELVAVAMAPEFPEAAIRKLAAAAKLSPGLLGFMSNVAGKAKFLIRHGASARTEQQFVDVVKDAGQRMMATTAYGKAAKAAAEKAAGRTA
jgi:hypothetical protein